MNQKKKVLLLLVISLGLVAFISGTCLAGQTLSINIKGKIVYLNAMGGYYVQSPKENYIVLNQNPAVLAPLATSGQTVTIRARVVVGDNISILSINGEPYSGSRAPVFK